MPPTSPILSAALSGFAARSYLVLKVEKNKQAGQDQHPLEWGICAIAPIRLRQHELAGTRRGWRQLQRLPGWS
jgi:hypothetical protein